MEYGLGSNLLFVSINGVGNFVPISLGQTVQISGVQVTFPPKQRLGYQNLKEK